MVSNAMDKCGWNQLLPLIIVCVAPVHVYTPELNVDQDDGVHYGGESKLESSEQRLMRALVGDYDNSVRPVYDAMRAVDIKLGLTLTQIIDLDEKNQVLTTNVWLEAEWFDERLNWSAPDYGGLYAIRIPCEKLWLPDIVLYNSVDDYTSGYMPSLAMVYNTSRVFWGPVIRFRSSCKIDITFFPFDTQVCRLKLGSWAYTGFEVNVWNSSSTLDLSNFVDNGEWQLLGVAVRRNVVFYNCCDEPFPDVTFSIQLRRKTKYYFMNIIIPCIILSFLCLGGFLLPPESGEKITLGLSVLLTITVFMLMVADRMPQTSESISVISIYLMVVLATSCLSVLSSVLVLSIHHQRDSPSRAPSWLRKLCFRGIAPILCIRHQHEDAESGHIVMASGKRKPCHIDQKESKLEKGIKIASIEDEYQMMDRGDDGDVDAAKVAPRDTDRITRRSYRKHQVYGTSQQRPDTFYVRQHRLNASYTPMKQQRSFVPSLNDNNSSKQQRSFVPSLNDNNSSHQQRSFVPSLNDNKSSHQQRSFVPSLNDNNSSKQQRSFVPSLNDNNSSHQQHFQNREPRKSESNVSETPDDAYDDVGESGAARDGSRLGQTYNLVVQYLINLIETRQEAEMRDEEIFEEWHNVAYVLDRLLFCFFFLVTLLSTVCVLEMRPTPQTI